MIRNGNEINTHTNTKRVTNGAKFQRDGERVCVCLWCTMEGSKILRNAENERDFDGCNRQNWNGIEELCQECQLNRTLMKCSAYLKFIANAFISTLQTRTRTDSIAVVLCALPFGMVGGYQFHNMSAHIFKLRQTNYSKRERRIVHGSKAVQEEFVEKCLFVRNANTSRDKSNTFL